MLVEVGVEARGVEVEAVAVLHRELSYAEQASLWAWFVSELPLDLIPDLGERLVAVDLGCGLGEGFFVGHRQTHLGARAILEAEHLLAHGLPTARCFPQRLWVHAGEEELLAADGVHLFADDVGHLLMHPPAQRQHVVVACVQLTDEAAANQQLVANGLGVTGCISKGGNKQVRPSHSGNCTRSPQRICGPKPGDGDGG